MNLLKQEICSACLKIIKRPDNFRGDRGASYSYAAKVLKIHLTTMVEESRSLMNTKSLKEKQDISKDADGQFR